MDSFERQGRLQGFRLIAGIDEAGRGPLAGPVVAAAVVFPEKLPPEDLGIKDSKALTAKRREALLPVILKLARASVAVVWEADIDSIGIHRATLLAMERAVALLPLEPDLLLIDGPWRINSSIRQKPIVGGDAKSVSVASASIVAKTFRDRIMAAYHIVFPQYNFIQNKGYGTERHLFSIKRYGPSPVHRRSFRGVS